MASIFTTILGDCSNTPAGNKYMYVAEFCPLRDSSISTIDSSGYGYLPVNASTYFVKYIPQDLTLDVTENPNTSEENQATSVIQTVNTKFAHRTLAKRNQLRLLSRNKCIVIVVDQDGTGRLYGHSHGLSIDPGSAVSSGAKLEDFNGYTITLKGTQTDFAPYLNATEMLKLAGL